MNATLTQKNTTNNFTFNVDLHGITYQAVIYTNESGKFIDDEITYQGMHVHPKINEEILEYLSENWTKLGGE